MLEDDDQKRISSNGTVSTRTNVTLEKKQAEAEELMDIWIFSCQLSFSTVQNEKFRQICEHLNRDISAPSRYTIWNRIFAVHLAMKINALIINSKGRIKMTPDAWS